MRETPSEHDGFGEPKAPFSDVELAHLVLEALSQSGHSPSDPKRFVQRLQHVEYGLSAETECAAVLAWLGNCAIVHALDQGGYTSAMLGDIQIPDLLCVFRKEDQELRVLIEVKSTEGLSLRWNNEYHGRLQRYAGLLQIPLLLAWRCRQLSDWLLIDPSAKGVVEGGKIELGNALVNNLMGVLAGDFRIAPKPGIGINFHGEFVGAKAATDEGYQATVRIQKAFWGMREKEMTRKPNASAAMLLLATATEHYCEEAESGLSWGYLTPECDPDGCHSVSVQTLLRMLVGWSTKDDDRIAWRHVLRELNHIKSKPAIEKELAISIGEVVRYILHVQPPVLPNFVPTDWVSAHRKAGGPAGKFAEAEPKATGERARSEEGKAGV